jgi:signal transduction histidine kinase
MASLTTQPPTTQPPTQASKGLRETLGELVTPSPGLSLAHEQKARLLASVTLALLPLAIFAVFLSPVNNLIRTGVFNLPSPTLMISLALIVASYVLSRTRYYWWGAILVMIVPYVAVGGTILTSTTTLNPTTFYFLALSVLFASLLMTARETLIAGVVTLVVAYVLFNLKSGILEAPLISFVVITTGLTSLVSTIRDRNLRALEASQEDLKQQVVETTRAREQAERSDQVKSAFLASMSHELRTPLNAIINFTRYVAKGAQGPVNEEQTQTLNEVVDSAKHLLNLINDVLDMSKIESGSLRLFVEDNIELKPIIDSIVSTGKTLISEKPVEIQTDVTEAVSVIRGDRQRIMQILLNIMSNACKFTEAGSIKLRTYQQGNEIVFSIADTGPGIGLDDQKAVFEAFKQTNTGLRQGGGTGLGMPISKSLAEAHGGRLWLESKVGNGTTFYVALPIKSEKLVPSLVA